MLLPFAIAYPLLGYNPSDASAHKRRGYTLGARGLPGPSFPHTLLPSGLVVAKRKSKRKCLVLHFLNNTLSLPRPRNLNGVVAVREALC